MENFKILPAKCHGTELTRMTLAGLQQAKRSQKMCFQKTIFGPLPKVKNRFCKQIWIAHSLRFPKFVCKIDVAKKMME